MATSGSTDWSVTRADICRGAALKIGAIGSGITMSAEMTADFSTALNAMVKRWSGKDIKVWTIREATLFPQAEQVKYSLSSSSADHCTESFVTTAISADEAAGQTAISVDDDDGIADNDYFGIILDDGTMHWSTVNGTPAGNVVTIDDAMPSAASADSPVYAYTTKIVRPLRIPSNEGAVRRFTISSGNDTPIGPPMARLDYNALPQKTQTGTINQVFYDPQLSTGYLYLWQPLATVTDLVKFTWHRPIEDFDSAGDNPDLPQEWIDTLIFNLAVVMAPEFDVPEAKFNRVRLLAAEFLDDLQGYGREIESVYFAPDMDPR